MIYETEESGAARISMRCGLGEWGSAEAAGASTPAQFPGLRQHPFASRTGRSPVLMMPWLCHLRLQPTVRFLTTVGAR